MSEKPFPLINTPLQRGVCGRRGPETVSTVSLLMPLEPVALHQKPEFLSEATLPVVLLLRGDVTCNLLGPRVGNGEC